MDYTKVTVQEVLDAIDAQAATAAAEISNARADVLGKDSKALARVIQHSHAIIDDAAQQKKKLMEFVDSVFRKE